ncbi:DUF4421 family protein [uncultured Draconibacterium sp.]|uniref:DUF4421 family protein n=1 Tax=uncultured Draconibacterium sp. TaxID=1573823 RepID=UPI0026341EFA|nr:DUF4421 family protein [uncultured Draconibacterium sp.]
MKLIATILFSFLVFLNCYAQTEAREKDAFIEKHNQQLAVKLSLTNNTEFFQIYQQDQQYTIKPNTSLKTNLILSYRALLFGVGYSPKFIPGNDDDAQKGQSKIFWMGTNVNLPHWTQHLEYTKIKGFYLHNSSNLLQSGRNDADYFKLPDLNYTRISGYTAYKMNPNFSFSAIETQTERQLKSAGSFVPSIVYRYYIIDNKTELGPNNTSQKTNNLSCSLQLGYFYTWVINKSLFVSGGAATGGGIIHTKLLTRYYTSSAETKTNYAIFRAKTMLAAGYNADRFFAGIQLTGNIEGYKQQKTTPTLNENFQFQLYAGYCFDAPKFLSSIFN